MHPLDPIPDLSPIPHLPCTKNLLQNNPLIPASEAAEASHQTEVDTVLPVLDKLSKLVIAETEKVPPVRHVVFIPWPDGYTLPQLYILRQAIADRGYDVDEDTNSENQLVMTVKWSAVQKGDMGGTI